MTSPMTDVDYSKPFDNAPSTAPTIPRADYHLRIVDPELKTSKDGGKYISYRAVVQSGPKAGKSVFSMWSLGDDYIHQLKGDLLRLEVDYPKGLNLLEVAAWVVANIGGTEGIGRVTEKPRKDDPDAMQNSISKWITRR